MDTVESTESSAGAAGAGLPEQPGERANQGAEATATGSVSETVSGQEAASAAAVQEPANTSNTRGGNSWESSQWSSWQGQPWWGGTHWHRGYAETAWQSQGIPWHGQAAPLVHPQQQQACAQTAGLMWNQQPGPFASIPPTQQVQLPASAWNSQQAYQQPPQPTASAGWPQSQQVPSSWTQQPPSTTVQTQQGLVAAGVPAKETADPPTWAGWTHYREWKRAVRRWDATTDILPTRRGARIMRAFDWALQAKLSHIPEQVLLSQGYLDAILSVLDMHAGEHHEDDLRRALHGALMSWRRERTETLTQFTLRPDMQCREVERHGVILPEAVKGYLLLQGASLTAQSQANLRTLTAGQMLGTEVAKALRTMDTTAAAIDMAPAGKSLMTDAAAEADEPTGDADSWTSSLEEAVFAEVENLDLEEHEAEQVWAAVEQAREQGRVKKKTWLDNRKFKAAVRKDRSGVLGMLGQRTGAASASSGGQASDRQSGQGRTAPGARKKMTISELKLVSKCANCGQRGHWKADSSMLPLRLNKPARSASGVGGKAKALFQCLLPIAFPGAEVGFVEATVVDADLPHLLSVGFLTHLGANIDLADDKLILRSLDVTIPMSRTPGGHCFVEIAEWSGTKPLLISEKAARHYGVATDALMLKGERTARSCVWEVAATAVQRAYGVWRQGSSAAVLAQSDSGGTYYICCFTGEEEGKHQSLDGNTWYASLACTRTALGEKHDETTSECPHRRQRKGANQHGAWVTCIDCKTRLSYVSKDRKSREDAAPPPTPQQKQSAAASAAAA
eukprot:2212356-Amphidinium_carterae.1